MTIIDLLLPVLLFQSYN